MQGRLGLPVDCVSSAMTPPATILDSGVCNITLNPLSTGFYWKRVLSLAVSHLIKQVTTLW